MLKTKSELFFLNNGFLVIKNIRMRNEIKKAKDIFTNEFLSKFNNDPIYNRQIIKCFPEHPFIMSLFVSKFFINLIKNKLQIKEPLRCGPLVTHFTSNNLTGNGYGLPFHQDYPSMASSKKSIICWINLIDSTKSTHGIELLSGMHKKGSLPGRQHSDGYHIKNDALKKYKITMPHIKAGDILIMSPFLPHRTYVNQNFTGWKLSLSQRFDDFSDTNWAKNGFKNAYRIEVDRNLYKKINK